MPIPDFASLSVLVTGGAGFIGSHLVDELVARGARVRVLDNLATGRRENLAHHPGVELVEGDLRDRDACRAACSGAAYVFHLAALGSVPRSLEDPATTIAVNVGGTAELFDAARRTAARRVIFATSSSVYGDSPTLPKREGEEGDPLSPYAVSKAMGEELARTLARAFGQESISLRYFNVFGPRQDPDGPYAAAVPRFFRAALDGRAPIIYGDGEQSRDFTFVADAVAANLLAAGAPAAACGRAYNVASGRAVAVNVLAARIRELAGGGPVPVHAPPRAGDVRHSLADLTAAERALGYAPRTSLDAGLRACLDYFWARR